MNIGPTATSVLDVDADVVVVGLFADAAPEGPAAAVDEATGGLLTRLKEAKEITGKRAETLALYSPQGVKAPLLVVVGLGDREKLDREAAFQAAAAGAKRAAGKERSRAAFYLADGWNESLVESGAAGSLVGCQGQDLYRAEKNLHPFEEVLFSGDEAAIDRGRILGEAINLTRRVVNEPPQEMYPESFARCASEVADACGLQIEVWDKEKLTQERAGSLLAVAKGSARDPRLVILRYGGGEKSQSPLGLVGKGVTFDSGGLSLKPTDSMKTMKCDMAGAGTVLGAMQAIARLQLPVNVIGLMGLVENMTGGDAMKLGDVLTARSGKTIEVLNTDAEGRLVLADVLNVALECGVGKIIDLATLTGACVVALGVDVAGLMSNNNAWRDEVAAAAAACGEPVWPLPMFDDFATQIKSKVADIKNICEGRWGGAITAAKFLEEFVEETPWTHIDIAGPAFLDSAKSWIDAGATGALVRTLVEVARGWRG